VQLDSNFDWLQDARRVPSPNADERPPGATVELLVVHSISLPPGEFGGPHIEALFTNALDPGAHPYFAEVAARRVSAHVLIRRGGEVVQFVSFNRRAWHAGESCFEGRRGCNDFSIGVELEGCDDVPYESIQYSALTELVSCLAGAWPVLMPHRIVRHSDIAPGRKTDPGPAFEWERFREALYATAPAEGRERRGAASLS
jgi:AmpD protein